MSQVRAIMELLMTQLLLFAVESSDALVLDGMQRAESNEHEEHGATQEGCRPLCHQLVLFGHVRRLSNCTAPVTMS